MPSQICSHIRFVNKNLIACAWNTSTKKILALAESNTIQNYTKTDWTAESTEPNTMELCSRTYEKATQSTSPLLDDRDRSVALSIK